MCRKNWKKFGPLVSSLIPWKIILWSVNFQIFKKKTIVAWLLRYYKQQNSINSFQKIWKARLFNKLINPTLSSCFPEDLSPYNIFCSSIFWISCGFYIHFIYEQEVRFLFSWFDFVLNWLHHKFEKPFLWDIEPFRMQFPNRESLLLVI